MALKERVDIVITDVKMPDVDGFEVLRCVKEKRPDAEVIMITGFGDVSDAVQAIKAGAFDFFAKPVEPDLLTASLQRTVRFQQLQRESDLYRERLRRLNGAANQGLDAIIGRSDAMERLRSTVQQVAAAPGTSVLITGETGTGKELVARAIHAESQRNGQPFVAVDCSAIPRELAESEFYGHVKGAFTGAQEDRRGHFELAHGGTLFLDEIGDMPVDLQVKLLRTLEERVVRRVGGSREVGVDVRVVSATNQNLADLIPDGRFREDLYYRLNTFVIDLVPLRDRQEDVADLAEHFLNRYRSELHKQVHIFAPEAIDRLRGHRFPGNVRELRNLVERAVILCDDEHVLAQHVLFDRLVAAPEESDKIVSAPGRDDLCLERMEREAIEEALRRSKGNQSEASRLLHISRDALRRRMANHGLLPGA